MLVKKDTDSTSAKTVNSLLKSSDRGNGLISNEKTSYSIDDAGKQISRGEHSWNGVGVINKEAEVTYTFPKWEYDQINFNEKFDGNTHLSEFTEKQKEQAERALQAWADVANIKFTKIDHDKESNITFGNFKGDGQAYATMPHSTGDEKDYRGYSTNGQSWFNIDYTTADEEDSVYTNLHPKLGNYGRLAITHEIGHTLGLDHPGEYNGNQWHPSYKDATYTEDSHQYTSMSYWNESNTGGDHQGHYPAAPLIDDIAAIQRLYGPNMETRTGDTTYGFNSNTDRDFYTAKNAKDKLVFSVWDAGGNDTFDFSGFNQDQTINLNATAFSNVGGLKNNISIAKGVTIENATGGSGNDIIIGNDADNILIGGDGDDIIYGGRGQDTLTGGKGHDIFLYLGLSDSPILRPDTILDFESGIDKIDFSTLNLKLENKDDTDLPEEPIDGSKDSPSKITVEVNFNFDEETGITELVLSANLLCFPTLKINIIGQIDAAEDILF